MVALQNTPDRVVKDVCGTNPSTICERVLDATGNHALARTSDLVFGGIGKILLVLLLAYILNRFVRRAIDRFAIRVTNPNGASETLNKIRRRAPSAVAEATTLSTRAAARARTMAQVLRSVASALIWSIAAITVLGELGINLGPLIASAGIAGIAFGFGAQSLVKDFISGFFMLVEDQYGVGDIVDLGEASGTVEEVSLRTTRLRDVNGTVWHVPNGTITRVGNKSQQWARALLDVNVAYGTDIDEAEELIKETADSLRHEPKWAAMILEDPEMWGVEQMGLDSITIRLVIKTMPAQQFGVTRELRRRLLRVFHEHGIEIANVERMVIRDIAPENGGPAAPSSGAEAGKGS